MKRSLHVSRSVSKCCLYCLLFQLTLLNLSAGPARGVLENKDVIISGTVKDSAGEPIPGVAISVFEATLGTTTDLEGKYSLSVPEGSTLVFSFIGFESQRIPVGDRSIIDIVLREDMTSLEEVVVVGYGTQEKRNVTGAISSVDEESIRGLPVASSVEAIQGQVSGVDIVSSGGRPGQNPQILIRGRRSITASDDPLYVIDGIPQSIATSSIFDINLQDVTSMEILKDAAATARYGCRGANGVIIIPSEMGTKG